MDALALAGMLAVLLGALGFLALRFGRPTERPNGDDASIADASGDDGAPGEPTSLEERIAAQLRVHVGEPFDRAWLKMAFEEDHGAYHGRFVTSEAPDKTRSFFLASELQELLWDFWRAGGGAWSEATFTLHGDGRVEVVTDAA